ncbi:hypothetical protein N658DRAFT_486384 [Parathielavia hyrcaniae]|uniref:Uncharacterized protein n=1 Tax=Parathielavia hyrcaniae TaxID=113614 RepID=A0AAN6T0W3_9PEZI|nr:hypothetical protein N658DRAFT_486384 [Parathielavia hyrcaniae]
MSERMNWDHHADHDLLTAMMQELQPTQEQLRGIMSRMHGFGYTCTVKAITQHLQKLRRKEDKNGGGGDASAGPSTPKPAGGGRKKSVALSVKKEPGSGTKRKSVVAISDDEEDVKPSKKAKDEAVKKEEFGEWWFCSDSDIAYAG